MDLRKDVYKTARLKIVTLLLSAGADASAVDENRNNALHLATLHGHIDCARLLLVNDDTALTVPNKRGEIPLFISATDQLSAAPPMNMVEFLTRWHILNRPLHRAVASGNVQAVQEALESGHDISARNMLGDAAIHLAAVRGDDNMVHFLLSRGASADQKGYLGQTALHRAAAASGTPHHPYGIDAPVQKAWTEAETALFRSVSEHRQAPPLRHTTDPLRHSTAYTAVTSALLNTGLNPSLPDALLRTPLHLAAATSNAPVIELLLAHGADPNAPDLDLKPPLCHARTTATLTLLLHHNASLHLQPSHLRDVGHLAVQCGPRCVTPAMLHATDEQGRTPLVHAAQTGALACVEQLLRSGAHAGQLGKGGWSPLVQACERRQWEVARVLLTRGADPRECEHETQAVALHLAARGGSAGTVRAILRAEERREEQPGPVKVEAGSRRPSVQSFRSFQSGWSGVTKVVSLTDRRVGFYRWTPLHFAASMGHVDAVGTLLQNMERMEIIARDIDGFTAEELASGAGYDDIVRLMEERLS